MLVYIFLGVAIYVVSRLNHCARGIRDSTTCTWLHCSASGFYVPHPTLIIRVQPSQDLLQFNSSSTRVQLEFNSSSIPVQLEFNRIEINSSSTQVQLEFNSSQHEHNSRSSRVQPTRPQLQFNSSSTRLQLPYFLPSTTDPLLPTTYSLFPTPYYLLPATYYLLPTPYYLLPTTYDLLLLLPPTYSLLFITYVVVDWRNDAGVRDDNWWAYLWVCCRYEQNTMVQDTCMPNVVWWCLLRVCFAMHLVTQSDFSIECILRSTAWL